MAGSDMANSDTTNSDTTNSDTTNSDTTNSDTTNSDMAGGDMAADDDGGAPGPDAPTRAGAAWRFLELFGLFGLALAQPLLDLYSGNPGQLITRGADGTDIVAFVVILLLAPPVAVWLVEQLVGRFSVTARASMHRIVVAVLIGIFVLQVLPSRAIMAVVAVGVAAAVWRLWSTIPAVRIWIRFLALAPLLFAATFIADRDVHALVFADAPDSVQQEPDADRPSALVIVLDELPTSSLTGGGTTIDAELFPAIAELADDATFYPNNVTVAGWTHIAVAAIVSGKYPDPPSDLAHWSSAPETIFTLMGGTHDIRTVESVTELCPPTVCRQPHPLRVATRLGSDALTLWPELVSPLSDDDVDFARSSGDLTLDESLAATADAVEALSQAEPTLVFAHLKLPHMPWDRGPSGEPTGAVPVPTEDGAWVDPSGAEEARRQHLQQMQYTDLVIGELLDSLRTADAYEQTAIVLVADHGIAFTARESPRISTEENLGEIAYTPLIIKAPGQQHGVVDDRPTSTIDVLPTLAGLVRLDVPWETDGTDLAADTGHPKSERRFYRWWRDNLPAGDDGYVDLGLQPELEPAG